ncbi:MAG: HAMP domain-containing protein, partial [Deltaproteobacteria bacterium]|nr:HAMP domain-containing protein [Deltaproteobacteria bacterium]
MFHPKTLHQRTIIYILVPIFLFLTLAGLFGFRAVRKVLIDQWGQAALANLERAAHNIDMRLNQPKRILFLLEDLRKINSSDTIHKFIINQLNRIDGVVDVKVDWPENMSAQGRWGMGRRMTGNGNWHTFKGLFDITAPAYDVEHNSKTFSLVSNFVDDKGDTTGTIEVIIDFESLISQTVQTPWWNVYKAYIVDFDGHVLTSTINEQDTIPEKNAQLFATIGALEQKTMAALKDNKSGTVFGPGRPPEEISGFYRLTEAPWTMVVIAPGKKVLQPIIHFRLVYFLTAVACIGIILIFIRLMITQTTEAIKKVSQTASDLTQGIFAEPLPVTSRDEVGELTRNFNTMSSQLHKGLQLQEAMNIAREVQLTLLPQTDYSADGLEVSGLSVY